MARHSEPGQRSDRVRRSAIALAVAAMGVIDLASALLSHLPERLHALIRFVPTEVLDTSRTFTFLAGALLLVTAWGLRRGKRRAFVAALFLCAVSVPVNMLKAFDFEEATVAAALMFVLGVSGSAFQVKSRAVSLRDLRSGALVLGLAFVVYAVAGSWFVSARYGTHRSLGAAAAEVAYRTVGWGDSTIVLRANLHPAQRRMVDWYLNSLSVIGVSLLLGLAISTLSPVAHRRRREADVRRVAELIAEHGDSSVCAFALHNDIDYFFSSNRRAVIAYRFEAGTLLTVGDPIGPSEETPALLAAFDLHCREHDWRFAFFQARPEYLPFYRRMGWQALHIGEDPILWTDRFTLEGSAVGQVRRLARKITATGIEARMYAPGAHGFSPLADPEGMGAQMRAISDRWLHRHPGGEKGFCMGRFDLASLGQHWLAVAWDPVAQSVEGFITWAPIPARRGWALDLMRRRDDAPNGVMEYLIVRSLEAARERGDALLSLSLSALVSVDEAAAPEAPPLAERPSDPAAPKVVPPAEIRVLASRETGVVRDFPRVRTFLIERLGRFYDFENLFRWKKKFDPAYEDRFLVCRDAISLPGVALSLVRAQSPGGLMSYFRRPVAPPPSDSEPERRAS